MSFWFPSKYKDNILTRTLFIPGYSRLPVDSLSASRLLHMPWNRHDVPTQHPSKLSLFIWTLELEAQNSWCWVSLAHPKQQVTTWRLSLRDVTKITAFRPSRSPLGSWPHLSRYVGDSFPPIWQAWRRRFAAHWGCCTYRFGRLELIMMRIF